MIYIKNNTNLTNYLTLKRQKLKRRKNLRKLFIYLLICCVPILTFIFKISSIFLDSTSTSTNNSNYVLSSNSLLRSIEDSITICIDAGHGDWDVGAEGITGSYEKDINLAVALKLGEKLENSGVNVVYTRDSDTLNWSDNAIENLYERVNISKNNNSDLFISIHCNNSDESSYYNGVETWYNPNDYNSELFATIIQDELASLEYTEDRGIKSYSADYTLAVLDHNIIPSVLVELGFLSNYYDEAFLLSESGQELCATALYNAIQTAIEDILN
ncbi:N-acetylmuramoyl-L-alanine amidase [Clostridium celatum]|uniref:N-acetylmuramoyl-L-alanine amidase n=1 Tax=Clostridium celatum TaxID=36834 RepID=UPI000A06F167|nr:N-acetylmuramoyl-L-alanine amidase [Clostridium celatum]MCE9655726.1 N-acetylmuramoyl-L-alanine amidase [Clostridium celatum]